MKFCWCFLYEMTLVALCYSKTTVATWWLVYRFGKTVGKFMWILNISHAINVRFFNKFELDDTCKCTYTFLLPAFDNICLGKGVKEFYGDNFYYIRKEHRCYDDVWIRLTGEITLNLRANVEIHFSFSLLNAIKRQC